MLRHMRTPRHSGGGHYLALLLGDVLVDVFAKCC
jgi:hypothetical protein